MASKLLKIGSLEAQSQIELSLRQAFELLEPQLRPPFPLTIPTPEEYLQLNWAILYGVLCEPHFAKIQIKYLHAIVTDGYCLFVSLLTTIVNELYFKLVESARIQLIWLVSEMIYVSAEGIDGVLVSLLRQIVGGDFSDGNLRLCFELVSLFLSKWNWLVEEGPLVLRSGLYTYLRVLADHCRFPGDSKLEALKRIEIEFCIRVLREQFHLCLKIGRDLIRLLQDLVHVPEFRAVWKDLVLNPGEFKIQGFEDVSQLYRERTSSRYFLLRITPEMESQLRFLLTHVKLGSQKRHQAWFMRKFLCGSERETLICDIVRFICCGHHPSNDIIQSDVMPRWAVIGWLLKSCRKSYVEANVKLALFYDWLFFDERIDNIMNIEPAMLLMVNSVPKYVDMTHTLLEFLLLLVDNYDIERKDIIVRGVASAFNMLVRRGVVGSIHVLTSCDALSPSLKEWLGRFLKAGVSKEVQPAHLPRPSVPSSILPSLTTSETETAVMGELIASKCATNDGVGTKAFDASVPISVEPVMSCSSLVVTSESLDDAIENWVQRLGETVRKSNTIDTQILEKILLSFANLDGHKVTGDFALSPQSLSSKIAKELELNGYKLFSPLESSPNNSNCDDEVHSATALIIRTFIFSQHERLQEMLLSWSKQGFPVGRCLLSYALRLAYEAHAGGYLGNVMVPDNSVKFEIALKKFSIFGENTETIFYLIKNSLNWGFEEQHKVWGLIRSELAVSKVQVEKLILEIFCSGVLDPNSASIAVEGLLMLCSCCMPTSELVGAIMLLPNNVFQDFSAAVLATWAVSNASMLFDSLANFLEKLDSKKGDFTLFSSTGIRINHSAISWLLNYFNTQGMKGNDILNKLSVNIPDMKSILQL
ncbi:uncharacterized protein LOC100267166 isoform X3 [Vitis vinifera]|uniref:uncharacterized protein LOC100267166 isoform X3 n=1 Tax=Vitis vinifera TaxID=29760 RepID=UPI000540182F|nr:uncharacterized protein LOC100267166 isoform X3 [Vitis vinifera]XP_059593592.1 uncharacterized protein LOC100267166 isoform X3 [Vitis vinifera]|eukprot:XP_010651501.1 PREDICTED: integrator complex subunit 3 homolog isoform X3 [Vitis vinifera]